VGFEVPSGKEKGPFGEKGPTNSNVETSHHNPVHEFMPLDSPHLSKGQLYRAVVTTSNQPSLHPMISQRRKRKVKVFLSTDSFKQAMVDTVEDGSISFDSGIKQGNARYTHLIVKL
jgi:hypothetical protein